MLNWKILGVIATVLCAVSLNQFVGLDPSDCIGLCKELADQLGKAIA